jgi:hypothetical protein
MKFQCLDIAQDLPTNAEIKDIIVLDQNGGPHDYLRDMKTGTQKLLGEDTGGVFFAVSPDRRWLAYLKTTGPLAQPTPWLAVAGADGKEVVSIPYDPKWGGISRWLDNQRLIFPVEVDNNEVGKIPAEHYVLNPFTGKQQELPPFPSDVSFLLYHPSEGMMISYDPTLSYIVYPTEKGTTLLVNLHTHQTLASVWTPWEVVPRWSPDGQSFILYTYIISGTDFTGGDLFRINLQGQIQRLTQFIHTGIEWTTYSWSPDGQHIAMWLVTDGKHKNLTTLAILDTTSLDVVNTCITNDRTSKFPPELIWSPDGNQLVFEYSEINHTDKRNVVVVDIKQDWAVQIAENMTPVAWMLSP